MKQSDWHTVQRPNLTCITCLGCKYFRDLLIAWIVLILRAPNNFEGRVEYAGRRMGCSPQRVARAVAEARFVGSKSPVGYINITYNYI